MTTVRVSGDGQQSASGPHRNCSSPLGWANHTVMMSTGRLRDTGRGLLVAACGLVLMFQLMASALAGSTHLAVKFDAGEISLAEICGTALDSQRDRAPHIESVNTCCVWAKSVALAPLTPPPPACLLPERAEHALAIFVQGVQTSLASSPQGPPLATGPPRRS